MINNFYLVNIKYKKAKIIKNEHTSPGPPGILPIKKSNRLPNGFTTVL